MSLGYSPQHNAYQGHTLHHNQNQQQPPQQQQQGAVIQTEKPRSPSPRSEFLSIPDGWNMVYTYGTGGGGGVGGVPATSPTSLTVPVISTPSGAGLWRRVSSTSSSIFDMSSECEQLDRSIRENDVAAVKKFLEIHHGKFPVDLAASFLDKSSCDSRSRRQSHVSQDVEILLRKSQTLIDTLDRRESLATESDVPSIFRTSLHHAVVHGAYDVLKLLLKYGVDPNEPRTRVSFIESGVRRMRAASCQPELLVQQLQYLHYQRQLQLQQQQPERRHYQDNQCSWDGHSFHSVGSHHSDGTQLHITTSPHSQTNNCPTGGDHADIGTSCTMPTITFTTPTVTSSIPTITPTVSILSPPGSKMLSVQISHCPAPQEVEPTDERCPAATGWNKSKPNSHVRTSNTSVESSSVSVHHYCQSLACAEHKPNCAASPPLLAVTQLPATSPQHAPSTSGGGARIGTAAEVSCESLSVNHCHNQSIITNRHLNPVGQAAPSSRVTNVSYVSSASPKVIVSIDCTDVELRPESSSVAPNAGCGISTSLSKLRLPDIVEIDNEPNDTSELDISSSYSGPGAEDLFALPPLYVAVAEGRARAVRLLLRYGACPHVQDRHGCTPLHLACCPEFLNADCIVTLLRHGARVRVPNGLHITPFDLYPKVQEEQRALISAILSRVQLVPGINKRSAGPHGGGGCNSITAGTTPRSSTPGSEHGIPHSGANRSGSVSRFFKRLSSESRSRGRERKCTREDMMGSLAGPTASTFASTNFTTTTFSDLRERTSSFGSCKSVRSRHQSSCIVDDFESDVSYDGAGRGTVARHHHC